MARTNQTTPSVANENREKARTECTRESFAASTHTHAKNRGGKSLDCRCSRQEGSVFTTSLHIACRSLFNDCTCQSTSRNDGAPYCAITPLNSRSKAGVKGKRKQSSSLESLRIEHESRERFPKSHFPSRFRIFHCCSAPFAPVPKP